MLGVGPFVARSVCGALNRNLSGGTHHPFLYGTTTCSRADHYYYRTKPVSGHSGSFAGPNERCCGTPIKGFTWTQNVKSSIDRFIPLRKPLNIELCHYKLTQNPEVVTRWPNQVDMKHFNVAREYFRLVEYHNRITDAILPKVKRILNFNEESEKQKKRKEEYAVPKLDIWPNHARPSPQIRSPAIILDMPDLITDITHQVIDWSKKGDLAAIYENEVYLWNPTKIEPDLLTNSGEMVENSVRWNKKGDYLAFSVQYGGICIWHFPEKKEPRELKSGLGCYCIFRSSIVSIEWSKDNMIITGCDRGCISILTLPNLELIKSVHPVHSGAIIAVKLSKDEKLLATSSLNCTVVIFEWPTLSCRWEIRGLKAPTRAVAWHPWRDSLLCVGTVDGKLTLWNTVTEKLIATHQAPKSLHVDYLTFNELTGELVVSYWCDEENSLQDSRILVYSSFDNIVDAIKWHLGRIPYLVWNHNGTQLVTAGADENLCVWDFIDASYAKKWLSKKDKFSANPVKNLNAFGICIR